MPAHKSRSFYNKSLERALGILCSFDFDKQEQTLAELSSTQKLPRSTTHRLVSTLVDFDVLQYDPSSGKYSLGLRAFGLGALANNSFPVKKIAAPYLTELHARLNKTVALATLRDDQVVYVDKREDWRNPIRSTELGRRRPPHFGMFGQLLMAFLPDHEVDRILAKAPLTAYTKNSITDARSFKQRLRTIREQGYAIDNGGVFDGVSGIAAPVRDPSGEVVAGVGVSLITAAESAAGVRRIIRELCETTNLISRELSVMRAPERAAKPAGMASRKHVRPRKPSGLRR